MADLDRFTEELHEWTLNGKEPSCASHELRHNMDLQEKRLQKLGIQREEAFEHVPDELHNSFHRRSGDLSASLLYREARQILTYRRNGKKIRRVVRPVNLYAMRLDREGHKDPVCTCPNCGNRMKASQALNGCIYCGTYFEADDTYPCISSYYTVPAIVERSTLMDRIIKELKIAGVIAGLFGAALYFLTLEDMDLVFRIIASLFMGAFLGGMSAFLWYLLRSFLLLFRVFGEAFRTLPMLKTLRSRRKMDSFMEQHDPGFSYDYFEGRVLALFRTIAFSEQRDRLSVWGGDTDLSYMDDIADIQYRGALQILGCTESDGILYADVRIFLHDTYMYRSLRERNETFRILMEKEKGAGDPFFSIYKVTCPHCGGSFDALHQKNCPYCGNAYELRKKDWLVRDIIEE